MPPKRTKTITNNTLSRVEENRYKQSKKFVIGIDEAGRGPLAGPVVAASIICDNQSILDGIMDSKATKEEHREKLYEILINSPDIYWGVSIVSHTEIDEINILQASLAAMRRSTFDLIKKYPKKIDIKKCIALIDGNKIPDGMPCESQYIIKGDSKIYTIAAASIIAKVTRDRIMLKLDKEYPLYNLAQHKGYPTFAHRQAVHKFGPSPIHRFSYAPVREAAILHGLIPPPVDEPAILHGLIPPPVDEPVLIKNSIKKKASSIPKKVVIKSKKTNLIKAIVEASGVRRSTRLKNI